MSTLRKRWGCWVVVLGMGTIALATEAAAAEPAAGACSAALLEPEARGVPSAVALLADGRIRQELASAGCPAVDRASVAAMRQMLGLQASLAPHEILQLGRSLMVGAILALKLEGAKGQVAVELSAYAPTTGAARHRSARVPAAELLPTIVALAAELARPAADSATTNEPVAERVATPASAPSTAPSAAPASAPSTAPSTAPASAPSTAPSTVPSTAPAAPPTTAGAAAAPAPVPTPTPTAPAPGAPLIIKRAPAPTPLFTVGVDLQTYYLFGEARGGPIVGLEVGSGTRRFQGAFLFRVYPGDATGYLLGGRLEGRPGWGRFRLVFGAELGFVLVPGNQDNIDLLLLGLEPLGVALEWQHLRLSAKLLGTDVYLVPADLSAGRSAEALYGLSHGLSLTVF
ncbi:MAG: hypothetical protein IPL40_11395 [Proteobacteria bacterium]|nr:hypothetical protein [Pseudomonadota bacterium]